MSAVQPAGGTRRTSTKAIIGLVLALVSWVTCPIVAAIPALVLAHSSDQDIARSSGHLDGGGLNIATRILAWLNIGLSLVVGIVVAVLAGLGIWMSGTVERSLDSSINDRTGLPDGVYVMDPDRYEGSGDQCIYGGPVSVVPAVPVADIDVYGEGSEQCPDLEFVNVVYIAVEQGSARIITVE